MRGNGFAMTDPRSPLSPVVHALEAAGPLDPIGRFAGSRVRSALRPGAVKNALSGAWLGHALHPLLTDLVVGSFVSATVLDVLGGDDRGAAQRRLIGVGIAAYGPTALTGVSDWADAESSDPAVRRVGLIHAVSNSMALGLYSASLAARRRGDTGRGKLLGLGGAAALGAAGYLGGHLTYSRGVRTPPG